MANDDVWIQRRMRSLHVSTRTKTGAWVGGGRGLGWVYESNDIATTVSTITMSIWRQHV